MLERYTHFALITLALAFVACGEQGPIEVSPDPIDEAFYAGEKADSLGLSDADERALLLFVNIATAEELNEVPSCSIRATNNILERRQDEGTIRSLYELDTVPYVGKATFRALVDHVIEQELSDDVEFWNRSRPEFMQVFSTSQAVVFGGPSGRSRWIRTIKIQGRAGDRVAMRLVNLDGGVNPRIDLEATDDSLRIVENPYSLKEARFPEEATTWHEGFELRAEEHTVAIQNRGAPGQFLFEMRCVGGPCHSDAEQDTTNDYLFRGVLRGSADMEFSRSGSDGAAMPTGLEGLDDYDLKNALWERHQANHREMTYDQARELLFSLLHNDDGVVTGVYSGVDVETTKVPHSWVMNVEHAWPRSHGDDNSAFISDLHHLYPTVSWVNSARANYAYCDLARLVGYRGEARWGYDADGSYCFEPRAEFKGNAARSLFYVSAAYSLRLDPAQERVLRAWHVADPVDQAERDRNDAVAELQGTRNLFVDYPDFVDRIDDF